MSKFTAGKWEVGEIYNKHYAVFVGTHAVADCFDNRESEGNARLIAAAPEMYELLSYFSTLEDVTNDEAYNFFVAVRRTRRLLARIDEEEGKDDTD